MLFVFMLCPWAIDTQFVYLECYLASYAVPLIGWLFYFMFTPSFMKGLCSSGEISLRNSHYYIYKYTSGSKCNLSCYIYTYMEVSVILTAMYILYYYILYIIYIIIYIYYIIILIIFDAVRRDTQFRF